MGSRRLLLLFFFAPLLIAFACYAGERPCYTPQEAADHAGKEICLAAHVYNIVDAQDGSRYLDVCKPGVPDASCRFTIVSLAADRKEVGSLEDITDRDVHLRGRVHAVRGQTIMLLSNARQFHDGAEKFRPNPSLMAEFGADRSAMAFHDPSMSSHRKRGSNTFAASYKSQ